MRRFRQKKLTLALNSERKKDGGQTEIYQRT